MLTFVWVVLVLVGILSLGIGALLLLQQCHLATDGRLWSSSR